MIDQNSELEMPNLGDEPKARTTFERLLRTFSYLPHAPDGADCGKLLEGLDWWSTGLIGSRDGELCDLGPPVDFPAIR
jgi:hypothetical protein